MTTYYMHTIRGEPATFDGERITLANYYGGTNQLAASLEQIRDERACDVAWRERNGSPQLGSYDYLVVQPPAESE